LSLRPAEGVHNGGFMARIVFQTGFAACK